GTLAIELPLSRGRYASDEQRLQHYQELSRRVAELPGVASVALTSNLPTTRGDILPYTVVGQTVAKGEEPLAMLSSVSPGYFATVGIPLEAGRTFDERDTARSAPVVVVSRALARRAFGDKDPVGQRLRFEDGSTGEIVGVVGTVRDTSLRHSGGEYLY